MKQQLVKLKDLLCINFQSDVNLFLKKVVKLMKNSEIRELTNEEILKKIDEYKEELFNLRFSQATGNLEKPSRIKELRKLVARMKTILRERELKEN